MPMCIYQIAEFLKFSCRLSPHCMSQVSTHLRGVHHGVRERLGKDALVSWPQLSTSGCSISQDLLRGLMKCLTLSFQQTSGRWKPLCSGSPHGINSTTLWVAHVWVLGGFPPYCEVRGALGQSLGTSRMGLVQGQSDCACTKLFGAVSEPVTTAIPGMGSEVKWIWSGKQAVPNKALLHCLTAPRVSFFPMALIYISIFLMVYPLLGCKFYNTRTVPFCLLLSLVPSIYPLHIIGDWYICWLNKYINRRWQAFFYHSQNSCPSTLRNNSKTKKHWSVCMQ